MASIRKEISVGASPLDAWDALRDYGAVHERVAPGFVVDARVDGQDRVVTFRGGAVATERLITLDDAHRRLVYSVVKGSLDMTHHQASVEVLDHDDGSPGCRVVWTTDVLPDTVGPLIEGLMESGARAIAVAFAG